MSRIVFLMLFFVFVASVGFWGMDQYKIQQESIVESASEEIQIVDSFELEEVSDEVQDYMYGFFEGESEIRSYENLEIDEVKELLDEGYELLVILDGSLLDQTRYNFDGLKVVKVGDYDGEFFYTTKYGMEVSGGFMISIRDFEKSFSRVGGMVIAFALN